MRLRRKTLEKETCPTFFVKDDKIVDVAFFEFHKTEEGGWHATPGQLFVASQGSDRVVFELPSGCYSMPLHIESRDSVHFARSASVPLQRCEGLRAEWADEPQKVSAQS